MKMYPTILALHGSWRWAVLLTAALALSVAVAGLAGRRSFTPWGRKAGVLYVTALDMQLLLGLLLYAASPLVRTALSNFAGAMKIQEMRFFAVEHLTCMLVAVVLAHVGSVLTKRAAEDRVKYRRMLLWNAASLAMIALGLPWWRPLFRGLASF